MRAARFPPEVGVGMFFIFGAKKVNKAIHTMISPTSILIIIGSLLVIALVNHVPFLPRSWLDKVRVFLGLLVTILVVWNLWPWMNRPMKAAGAVVLGVSGVVIVEKTPIVSSVVPGSAKMGVQVAIGAVAAIVALRNAIGWAKEQNQNSTEKLLKSD